MIRASSGKAPATRRMLIGAGVLALLIPAIAGCEAGTDAPTLQFHPASVGAHYNLHGLRISRVFVLGAPAGSTLAPGSSAGLFLSVYNEGGSADKLIGVSTPSASSVTVGSGGVALPVQSAVNLTGPQPELVLSDLTKPLVGGKAIPVTLSFQRAGSVTLQVPVEAQSFDFETFSPAPSPAPTTATPTAGATGTATATPTAGATGTATATATATSTP